MPIILEVRPSEQINRLAIDQRNARVTQKRARLQTLKPRVQTLGNRITTAKPATGFNATQRDRGRPWRRRRADWLRAHPLCAECEAKGYVRAATEVDHVIPLWKGGADDESNYRSMCGPDHAAKTAREAIERARGGVG